MTAYVLDTARWRSGEKSIDNRTGTGITAMLNKEGYMCCLGQFAQQKGVNLSKLESVLADPADVARKVEYSYDENFVAKEGFGRYVLTQLSRELISINDDTRLTPEKRIQALREKLEEYGHTLTVFNSNEETILNPEAF